MPARRRPDRERRHQRTIFDTLEWRLIGPFRGGRSVAVAGDPEDRLTFYMGTTGGGVWKTTDAGRYWKNVSDGYFKRASVGALAVAASDRNVVYAGMGEACIRGNVSHGDGVYRSTDAGRSWTHLGLEDTAQRREGPCAPPGPRHRVCRGTRSRARAEQPARCLPLA